MALSIADADKLAASVAALRADGGLRAFEAIKSVHDDTIISLGVNWMGKKSARHCTVRAAEKVAHDNTTPTHDSTRDHHEL